MGWLHKKQGEEGGYLFEFGQSVMWSLERGLYNLELFAMGTVGKTYKM